MNQKKVILIIMDGWGLGKVPKADAIQHAKIPFISSLYKKYPNTTLVACGNAVGLPEGQMGNSEVGHLNLGAGRIVYQELERINVAIRNSKLAKNEALLQTIQYAKKNNKPLHLMGLLSDGGVHSHINHLKALVAIAAQQGLPEVYIHAFTDGRDTDPKSGIHFIEDIQQHLQKYVGQIATITGRYYAMDRDKRWERIKIAYDALVNGVGQTSNNIIASVKESYNANITDEFIKPIINNKIGSKGLIKDDDAVICFNFRTDRCREITQALTQQNFPEKHMLKKKLYYTTLTEYDHTFKDVHIVFENSNVQNTLGEVFSQQKLRQLRAAETEKYPHVTFFFSGGRETLFEGEERILIPSPKVATYDLQPEMSAYPLTDATIEAIQKNHHDFICLNYANADMVGHTGIWDAIIKAVETVDTCVEKIVTTALKNGYTIFLTADHGNADYAINENGSPNTAHSLNLVPLFIINDDFKQNIQAGKLGDIAPTILHYMNLPIPKEMTGNILITDKQLG